MDKQRNYYRSYCGYLNQEDLNREIQKAKESAVIDWDNAKIFCHIWNDRFFISDRMESSEFSSPEDAMYYISLPLTDNISSKELAEKAEQQLAELLNEGIRPRFFRNATYIMTRLHEGDKYKYDTFDSFAGYIYKYISTLAKTKFLDIEEFEEYFEVKRIDSKGWSKRRRKSLTQSETNDEVTRIANECAQREAAYHKAKSRSIIQTLPDSFVGIDFETLYPQRVSACSVGMVKYKDGNIVDRYYTLIRPPFEYEGKKGMALTWIHGFTEDMFDSERTMQDIMPEMEAFAEGLPLVAHNACVERACIEETAKYYGIDTNLDTSSIIDTLYISKTIEKSIGIYQEGCGQHSLDAVCRRFSVPELCHHNALDDAEMCGNLILAFKNAIQLEHVEITEPQHTSASSSTFKYNEEDKIQRTDLENVPDNPFKDQCVVLTGFSKDISQQYGHKLKEAGAKLCTGVSFKTKWLICGSNAGPSKMEKAKQVGANIINEEEFLNLINYNSI